MNSNFENIHAYYKELHLDNYLGDIINVGEEVNLAARETLAIKSGFIYFPVDGTVAISIEEDGLVVGNAIEYMPIGLMERRCPLVHFFYRCMTPVKVIKLSCAAFDQIFMQSPRHIEAFSTILLYMTIFSLDVHSERKQASGYQTIKSMLYRYLYRTEEFEDESEGIANFIMRRTNLSRTHVFRVLADLKTGGYITITRGKLVSINRELPEEY